MPRVKALFSWIARTAAAPVQWAVLSLRRVDIDTLPEIEGEYPKRLATLYFEAGVAALGEQQSQAAALDAKLAVSSGASITIVALLATSLSNLDNALGEWTLGRWLVVAGTAIFLFAFANSVRGLWPRMYRSLPDLPAIRKRAAEDITDEDARWSISVSLEQAVAVNDRVARSRLATVKLSYASIVLGMALVGVAYAPHFVARIITGG